MENKEILVMCVQNLITPKNQVFEEFGIDRYMQMYIMKTSPRIYVKSQNSTFNKLRYLQMRWKVEDL